MSPRACGAYWRGTDGEPAEVCGDPAPHEAADMFLCDIHYDGTVRWAAEIGRTATSLIYYVRRESDSLIKIGTSRTAATRIAVLEREHGPLTLMALHQGAHKEEHAIHRLFAELRMEGEWFRPELSLMEFILKARVQLRARIPEGMPEQFDLFEIERIVRRMKRQNRPAQALRSRLRSTEAG